MKKNQQLNEILGQIIRGTEPQISLDVRNKTEEIWLGKKPRHKDTIIIVNSKPYNWKKSLKN